LADKALRAPRSVAAVRPAEILSHRLRIASLSINLSTAGATRITVPPALLARADEIIDSLMAAFDTSRTNSVRQDMSAAGTKGDLRRTAWHISV